MMIRDEIYVRFKYDMNKIYVGITMNYARSEIKCKSRRGTNQVNIVPNVKVKCEMWETVLALVLVRKK